jgi:hypothetical protein
MIYFLNIILKKVKKIPHGINLIIDLLGAPLRLTRIKAPPPQSS